MNLRRDTTLEVKRHVIYDGRERWTEESAAALLLEGDQSQDHGIHRTL